MSDDPTVVQFMRPPALPASEQVTVTKIELDPLDRLKASVTELISASESLDTGMKLQINVITELDKRVRKLELAQRKADRRNMPAIVNQFGERQN